MAFDQKVVDLFSEAVRNMKLPEVGDRITVSVPAKPSTPEELLAAEAAMVALYEERESLKWITSTDLNDASAMNYARVTIDGEPFTAVTGVSG